MKVRLSAKAIIVYMIAQIVIHFAYMLSPGIPYPLSMKLNLLFSPLNIIFYTLYAVTIYLLLRGIRWGYILAALPPLWALANPMANPYSHMPVGKIPAIIHSISFNDWGSLLLHSLESIVPLVVIAFCLYNFFSKKMKLWVIWVFIAFAALHLSEVLRLISRTSYLHVFQTVIIIILYIAAVYLWEKGTGQQSRQRNSRYNQK